MQTRMSSMVDGYSAAGSRVPGSKALVKLSKSIVLEPAVKASGVSESNRMPSESASVKLILRCRPLIAEEEKTGVKHIVKTDRDRVTVQAAGKETSFSCDGAYSNEVRNEKLFTDHVSSLVRRATDGYNVTVMAFGATGSGKSYLMTGYEEDPGMAALFCRGLFKELSEKKDKEILLTASFVEILDEKLQDLLNPHDRPLNIRQHPVKGIYVDGLSELVVRNSEDLESLYDQGVRAREAGASDIKVHRHKAHSIFNVTIEQKEKLSSKVGLRAQVQLVDLAGSEGKSESNDPDAMKSIHGLLNVLSALGDARSKGGNVPYRESKLTRLLQESLGGNAFTLIFGLLSPSDKSYQETLNTLQFASYARNIKNHVRANLDETEGVISELRAEIKQLKDRIVRVQEPNRDDINAMEALVNDLQVAKRYSWSERERQSEQYEEERRRNLANKGLLDWVMTSMQKGSRELQDRVMLLQKEKDQLTAQNREKRKNVETLRDELQKRIADYSKYAESGKANESETKKRVGSIHEVKEKLTRENEAVKLVKNKLKEITDKQQAEKQGAHAQATALKGNIELRQKVESEERTRLEQDHQALLLEEVEKMKVDVENDKAEIQLRAAEGRQYSTQESAEIEMQFIELQKEKTVIALQLQFLEQEKAKFADHLGGLYKAHKDELEIQQLQHLQTFRQYREVFESQKLAVDQRYRKLLEDSIQDAVFLSSQNTDLTTENQELRQKIAEMKDVITNLGGRIPPGVQTL